MENNGNIKRPSNSEVINSSGYPADQSIVKFHGKTKKSNCTHLCTNMIKHVYMDFPPLQLDSLTQKIQANVYSSVL